MRNNFSQQTANHDGLPVIERDEHSAIPPTDTLTVLATYRGARLTPQFRIGHPIAEILVIHCCVHSRLNYLSVPSCAQ